MVKKLKELNLIDNFLFEALASHPEIGAAFGRKLVEIILRRSPEKVRVVAQRTYPGGNPQMHGARLDVYLEESAAPEKNVSWSYDIEPEKDSKPMAVRSLPKRVRFYHANFEQTTVENACNKDLTELHEMVSRVRMDEEVELEYMKIFEREEMIRKEGIVKGIAQGQSEGSILQLLRQIQKKVAKEKSPEIIAEELEENAASIAPLYDLIKENPDKSAEELLSCIGNSINPHKHVKEK